MSRIADVSATRADGWIRQLHRWLSLAFAAAAVANLVALALRAPAQWLGLLALLALLPLLATGLYLFALPYRRRRRRGDHG